MILKPLFLFAATLFVYCTSFCQSVKDTIYFDNDWSICEKPVAEYYRVCTLNKEKVLFYKGDVQNYYINGKLEMTGHYSDSGYKNGEFIFYSKNGLIIKKGAYKDDEAFGTWYYYDSGGNVRAEFICKSSADFTPVFLVNNHNDTLIKNGKGKFSFDTHEDLPHIFPVAETYFVEGEVDDSLKNGVFNYSFSQNRKGAAFSETYKNGKFLKGKSFDVATKEPLNLLHIQDFNLNKVDMFYHSNPIFYSANTNQEIINFLLTGQAPLITVSAQDFYDNDKILFYVIAKVLHGELDDEHTNIPLDFPFSNAFENYYTSLTESSNAKYVRNIKGDIVLTVDTSGEVINSVFSSTLTSTEINKINYYLARIEGLMPHENNNQKSIVNINLRLKTMIDTTDSNKLRVAYVIYNSDSADNEMLTAVKGVQIQAKFPGGPDAWLKFLERNLNAQTPSDHGAPTGNYAVTVSFLVDEYGNVSDVQALNDPGYGTAEEAVRVIKNGPKWVPAIQDGKNVKYRQKQNISFQVVKF